MVFKCCICFCFNLCYNFAKGFRNPGVGHQCMSVWGGGGVGGNNYFSLFFFPFSGNI